MLPKIDCTRKRKDFDTIINIAKNVGDLGKISLATGFEKMPKVQLISQSYHIGPVSIKLYGYVNFESEIKLNFDS